MEFLAPGLTCPCPGWCRNLGHKQQDTFPPSLSLSSQSLSLCISDKIKINTILKRGFSGGFVSSAYTNSASCRLSLQPTCMDLSVGREDPRLQCMCGVPASLCNHVWGEGCSNWGFPKPHLSPCSLSPYLSIRVITMRESGRVLVRRRCWVECRAESREGKEEEGKKGGPGPGSVRWDRAFHGREPWTCPASLRLLQLGQTQLLHPAGVLCWD